MQIKPPNHGKAVSKLGGTRNVCCTSMQLASWRRHSVDDDALIHILFYSVPSMILSPKLKRSFNMSLYSKTCVKRPLSKRLQIGFQYQLSLNAGQKVLQNAPKGSILQYIRPSRSYHLSLRSLFGRIS